MAQKLFFRKRRKIPEQIQIFFILLILIFISVPPLYFWGFVPVNNEHEKRPENIVLQTGTAATITNRWLRLQQPTRTDVATLKELFENQGQVKNWQLAGATQNFSNDECYTAMYFKNPPSEQTQNGALVFFFTGEPQADDAYAYSLFSGFTLLQTLSQVNLHRPLWVIFSLPANSEASKCAPVNAALKNVEEKNFVEAAFVFKPSATGEQNFSLVGGRGNLSNPKWFTILPQQNLSNANELYGNFWQQWLVAIFSFLQDHSGELLAKFIPAAGWNYAYGSVPFIFSQAQEDAKQILYIASFLQTMPEANFSNTSFFVLDKGGLKPFFFWFIVFLGFLFLCLHLVNFLYFQKQTLELLQGILSLIYFSAVPIFVYLLLKIFVRMKFVGFTPTLSALVAGFFLFVLLGKLDGKFVNIKANAFTSLFIFYLLLMSLIWVNPVLFLTLLPMGIFLVRVKDSSWFGAALLLPAGFLPLFLLAYLLGQYHPQINLLDSRFITQSFVPSWSAFLPLAFMVSSLITLVRRNDD